MNKCVRINVVLSEHCSLTLLLYLELMKSQDHKNGLHIHHLADFQIIQGDFVFIADLQVNTCNTLSGLEICNSLDMPGKKDYHVTQSSKVAKNCNCLI